VLGRHAGAHHFTVGQRRGLGVAAPEPLYVIATEPATQRVIVGRGDDLMSRSLVAKDVNWISICAPCAPLRAQVKIRNKHAPAPAMLLPAGDEGRIQVEFDQAQRAVTPGQAAVFYDGDLVLGGGWIA
jgi:tRNA-specific 2-thiouridylase